jgi:hypothetical protein
MTTDTVRDEVWSTVIKLAGDTFAAPEAVAEGDLDDDFSRGAYTGVGVTKPTVCERVDAGDRTVHDVLKTMVEYGLLDSTPRRLPHAVARERLPDSQTRQETTVYYPAGELADAPVAEDELIGYSPIDSDGGLDEETISSLGL